MTRLKTQTAILTALGLLMAAPATAADAEACPATDYSTDADGDGMVSAEEAQRSAEQEFSRLDLNKDQSVDRDEFVKCFTQASGEMRTEGSEQARDTVTFKRTDANVDGKISRDEYGLGAQQAHQQQAKGGGEQMARSDQQEGGNDQTGQSGQTADADQVGMNGERQGSASQGFAGVQTSDNLPRNAEAIAAHTARMFAMLDTDRDHVLTEEEWTAPADETRMQQRAAEIFDEIDLDGDDHVAPKEYVTALVSAHQNAVEAARGNVATSPGTSHTGGLAAEGEAGTTGQAGTEGTSGQDTASAEEDPATSAAAAQAQLSAQATGAQNAGQVEVAVPTSEPSEEGTDQQVSASPDELPADEGAAEQGNAPIFVYRIYRF